MCLSGCTAFGVGEDDDLHGVDGLVLIFFWLSIASDGVSRPTCCGAEREGR